MDETQILDVAYAHETYVDAEGGADGGATPCADLLCDGAPAVPLMFGRNIIARSRGEAADAEALGAWREEALTQGQSGALYGCFLPRAGLSQQHAAIVIQRGFYILEDLGSTNGSKLVDRLSGDTLPVAHQQRTTFDPANTRILLADVLLEVRPRAAPAAARPLSSPVYVPAGDRTPFMGMADSQRSLPDEDVAPPPLPVSEPRPPPPPLFAEPAAAAAQAALRTPAATLPPPDAAASPSAGFTAGLTQLLPARAAPDTLLVAGHRAASPLDGSAGGTDGHTVRLSFGDVAVAPPPAAPPASAARGGLGLAMHSPFFSNTIAGGRSPIFAGSDGGGPFGAAAAQPAFGANAAWQTEGQARSSQQADAAHGATLPADFSPPVADADAGGPTLVLDFDHMDAEATLGDLAAPPLVGAADTQLPAGADTQVPADAEDAPQMQLDEPAGATLEVTAVDDDAPGHPDISADATGDADVPAPADATLPPDAVATAPDYVSSLPDFFNRSTAPPEVAASPVAAARPASQRRADSTVAAELPEAAAAPEAAAEPSPPRDASAPAAAEEEAPAVAAPASEAAAAAPSQPAEEAHAPAAAAEEQPAEAPEPAPAPAASQDSDITVDEPGDAPAASAPPAAASERAPPLSPLAEEAAPPAAPPAATAATLPASGDSPAGHSGQPSQLAGALFGAGMSSQPSSQDAGPLAAAAAVTVVAVPAPAAVAAAAPPAAAAAAAADSDSDVTVDEPSPVLASGAAASEPGAVDSAPPAAPVFADSEPAGGAAAGSMEAPPAPLHLAYETLLQPPAQQDSAAASGSPDLELEARGLFETQCPLNAGQVANAWQGVGGFIPVSDPLAPANAAPPPAPAPEPPVVAPSPPPSRAALEMPPPPPRFPVAGSPAVTPAVEASRPLGGVGETQAHEFPAFAHFVGAQQLLVPPPPEEAAAAAPARAAKASAAEARKAAAAKKREKAAAAAEPEAAKAPASAARAPRKGRAAAEPPAAEAEPAAAEAAPPAAKAGPTPRGAAKKKDSAAASPPAADAGAAAAAAPAPPKSTRRGRGAKAPVAEAPDDDEAAHGTQELAVAAAPVAEAVPPVEVEGTQELAPAPTARAGRKSAAAAAAPPPPAPATDASPPGGRAKRGRKQAADAAAGDAAADAGGAALAPTTGAGRGTKRAKVSAAAEAAEAEPEAEAAQPVAPPPARAGRGKKAASPAKPAEASPAAAKSAEAAPSAAKSAGRGQKRSAGASASAEPAGAEEDGSAKRRRAGSDGGEVRILMSSNLPAAEARKLRDKLSRLARVTVLDDKDESLGFTHFLMSSSAGGFKRTRNALAALATGRPIVAPSWVEACVTAGTVVDASAHLLHDLKAEREFKFTMHGSFEAARRKKVLEGEVVYILPGSKPDAMASMLRDVVPLAGARLANAFSSDVTLAVGAPGFRDAERRRIVAAGQMVYTPEVILSALVSQRLDKSAHQAP